MKQASGMIEVSTRGQGLTDITRETARWVETQGIEQGLLTLFVAHTSASLVIQENADPDVIADLQTFFKTLVREDPRLYRHTDEGPDDMPAHIRAALTQTSFSIPLVGGRLVLGTWQGIYLFEHRAIPHRRRVVLHLIGS